MQGNINSAARRFAITAKEAKERIKSRGWICIKKSFSQPWLAGLTYGQVLSLVLGVTETGFPVPRFEIVAEFSHLTLEPNVKESVPVGELLTSLAGVVNATKPNPSSHRKTRAVRKEIWNSRIRDRERIKGILDRHTDALRTKAHVKARDLEWIGGKRHSCQG